MNDTVTVAISSDFLDSFARLPRKVQAKTSAFIVKFKNDPLSGGINYEKINSADKNLYSVRIDNTYRGIVMREKDMGVYLLLWVISLFIFCAYLIVIDYIDDKLARKLNELNIEIKEKQADTSLTDSIKAFLSEVQL